MNNGKERADIFTARGAVKRLIDCIRDWLILTGMNRELAYTTTMRIQEITDDALRKAAERQTREIEMQP